MTTGKTQISSGCPRAGSNQLISNDVVAVCRKFKAVGYESLPKIRAVDVARFGDDRTVIGIRQGRCFRVLAKLRGANTVETSSKVIECVKAERPDATVVDADGIGAGVVDQLESLGWGRGLHEFHGGARAHDYNKYFNRRAEVWGLTADWLKSTAQIPDDPELEVDLTAPQYGYSNKQQIQLEKKDDMKRRGLASPDLGDTMAMTFAVAVRARLQDDDEWEYWRRYKYRLPGEYSFME